MMDKRVIMQDGIDAFHAGKSLLDNPYLHSASFTGRLFYDYWKEGFDAATYEGLTTAD